MDAMTKRRLFVLGCVLSLLPVVIATPPAAGGGQGHHERPRIKSGRYTEGSSDVYLNVNVKARTVGFHFTLYCNDLFADQWVSSGPKPVKGELTGNRRGATVYADGEYQGAPAVGPGTSQLAFWTLKGRFTSPTRFEGRVEYEAATFPEPMGRPQCLDAARIHLTREP
jgi:hypothetical protein